MASRRHTPEGLRGLIRAVVFRAFVMGGRVRGGHGAKSVYSNVVCYAANS